MNGDATMRFLRVLRICCGTGVAPGLRVPSRKQRGASQVEFVVSFLVVVFLVFWMFELIMVMYTYSTLTDAAKEGVRYAIVHGSRNGNGSGPGTSDPGAANVQGVVTTFANISLHDVSAMTVTVTYPDGDAISPSRVIVNVSYPYVPYITLPWTVPTINASAAGRIAN